MSKHRELSIGELSSRELARMRKELAGSADPINRFKLLDIEAELEDRKKHRY